MKNILITLGVALAVCGAAFGIFYAMHCEPAVHRAAQEGDAMRWLREEFRLSDAQFNEVKKIHEAYGEACAGHCAAIMEGRKRAAPPAEMAALEAVCVNAMMAHFRRVAALMPPEQGERYLSIVLPRVAGYDHAGAPTVQVSR